MIIPTNKIITGIGGITLIAAMAGGAWFSAPVLFFVPLVLLICVVLVQYPKVLFFCLLAAIPWSGEVHFTESLGTDLPDEPLMLLTAVASVLLLAYQWKKKNIQLSLLLGLLLLQAGWMVVSAGLSTDPILSVKYVLAKGWYLLAFVAAPLLLADKKLIKQSAAVLCTSMALVTLVVLCRHAYDGFTFTTINNAVYPFFRNHVTYSALLVFMIPIQLCFWEGAITITTRRLILVVIILSVAAVGLSYARGAWLALFLAMVSYWLLKRKLLFKSFVLVLLLIVATFFWLRNNDRYVAFANDYNSTIFHQNFEEHLAATYQGKDLSTAERFYRWVAGVRMSADGWQTGFGPNTFYENYKSYTQPAFKTWVSRNEEHSTVHNYFLLLLVEQGVIGLLLFVLLIGALFWQAEKIYHRSDTPFWKNTSAAIAAILVMICTVNFLSDLIETDKVGSIFYLCIATLIVAETKSRKQVDSLAQ